MCNQELDLLEDDAKTFKVVGPVLMKIELKDARADVNTRIDYIQNEMYVAIGICFCFLFS